MTGNEAVNPNLGATNAAGPYRIYSAGGLFTQDELSTNILIKEAVWQLSNGEFQLFLPQSRELQELHRPDVEIYIRNTDLLEVVKADIILVRFDGLELDSGTVVEYMKRPGLGFSLDYLSLECINAVNGSRDPGKLLRPMCQ